MIGTSTAPIFITAKAPRSESDDWEPERDLVAGANAEGDQSLAAAVDAGGEVGEREASPLKRALARAPAPRRPLGPRAQVCFSNQSPRSPTPCEPLLRRQPVEESAC